MQFYLDGFHPGDPEVTPGIAPRPPLADSVDVLIVGTGPAGLLLAAQLARFTGITTRIVERRNGPLHLGQADGVACRTVETFHAFGLSDRLVREAYWVNEVTFWHPSSDDRHRIERTGRVQDVEDGLSEFPHVIVNQARIHDYLLNSMKTRAGLEPDYGLEFVTLSRDDSAEYPIVATLRDVERGQERHVRARYVVGCDGARSAVRTAIGRDLVGDAANHAWGVVDILPQTDFPDIRLKSAIQTEEGSILLIPREGGYLVRLYVDLGKVTPENRGTIRGMSSDEIIAIANRVLAPYTLSAAEVVWFSVYEVAQRLTDAFDDAAGRGGSPRVFIAGDACHTHSAKAGQGMNVSMQDTYNLGWKLAAVLRNLAPVELLETYSAERQPVAQELIDFDREWSALIAASGSGDADAPDPDELEHYFVRAGRYTAGVATRYTPSLLTADATHQQLATGFDIGMRFHSWPVVRIADARPLHLGHVHEADGRWRWYLFADRDEAKFERVCEWLHASPDSPLNRHTPAGADIDSVIDVRGVLQRSHRDIAVETLPGVLRPVKGRLGLLDQEKAFSAPVPQSADIFDARGIDRDAGALVIVRPDQFVSAILPLDDLAAMASFYDGILRDQAEVTR